MGNGEMKELFRHFDALAIKERVDALAGLAERWNALAQGETVRFSALNHFVVEGGIQEAAEAVGAELNEYKMESGGFLYYFRYKGCDFSYSSEKRLGKYEGKG